MERTMNASSKPNPVGETSFPALARFPSLVVSSQTAQAGLTYLDFVESWLTASRQAMDLWRTTVRELQDGALAAWRNQLVDTVAHELLEEMQPHAKATPSQASAPRSTPAQSSVLEHA